MRSHVFDVPRVISLRIRYGPDKKERKLESTVQVVYGNI